MKTTSSLPILLWTVGIVLVTFAFLLTIFPLQLAFLRSFGVFYYFFFNGYFLYRLFNPYEKNDLIQLLCFSFLLSISLNSLIFYLLNRTFHLQMTMENVLYTASGLLVVILIGHLIRFRRIIL